MNSTRRVDGIDAHNSQRRTHSIAPWRLTGIPKKPGYKWACVGSKDGRASPTWYYCTFLLPLTDCKKLCIFVAASRHCSASRKWRTRLEYFCGSNASNNVKRHSPSTLPQARWSYPAACMRLCQSGLACYPASLPPHRNLGFPPGSVAWPSPVHRQIEIKGQSARLAFKFQFIHSQAVT